MKRKRFLSVACCALLVLSMAGCGSKAADSDKPAKSDQPAKEIHYESKYPLYDEEEMNNTLGFMAIKYNGESVRIRVIVGGLIGELGLQHEQDDMGQSEVPGQSFKEEKLIIPLDKEGKTFDIVTYNGNEEARILDNTEVGTYSTDSKEISFDDVTIGTTTYEEILEMYGRDVDGRRDTFDEEVDAYKDEGRSLTICYDLKKSGVIARHYFEITDCLLKYEFEEGSNVVKRVTIEYVLADDLGAQ